MASSSITSSLSRLSLFRFTPKSSQSPIPFFLTSKSKVRNRFRLFSSSMTSEPNESPSNNPGLHATPDDATKEYFMQQTMYRIKDPKLSLDFYSRVLAMIQHQLQVIQLNEQFGPSVRRLQLNWDTESEPDFKGYHNGNSEPRGFEHIGITVDDTYKACERFERLGVEFAKRPDDGKMKGIAFIKDPDGYWIEIFDLKTIENVTVGAA